MSQPGNSSDRLARQIMWGLGSGVALGLLGRAVLVWQPGWRASVEGLATEVLDPFGQIFLRLLFFVVVPLVFPSIALGIVQLGRLDKPGPLAGRTFALFALNMAIAVALGLLMMNLLELSPSEDSSGSEDARVASAIRNTPPDTCLDA